MKRYHELTKEQQQTAFAKIFHDYIASLLRDSKEELKKLIEQFPIENQEVIFSTLNNMTVDSVLTNLEHPMLEEFGLVLANNIQHVLSEIWFIESTDLTMYVKSEDS